MPLPIPLGALSRPARWGWRGARGAVLVAVHLGQIAMSAARRIVGRTHHLVRVARVAHAASRAAMERQLREFAERGLGPAGDSMFGRQARAAGRAGRGGGGASRAGRPGSPAAGHASAGASGGSAGTTSAATRATKLSNAERARLGAKLSQVPNKTPRELLAGSGKLSRLERVPGGSRVDDTLEDLASAAVKGDPVAIRTLKELKKVVPELPPGAFR